jgi:hypothetical protein
MLLLSKLADRIIDVTPNQKAMIDQTVSLGLRSWSC